MRIKREYDCRRAVFARIADQRGDHALMAAMHAVEIADRHEAVLAQDCVIQSAKNLHINIQRNGTKFEQETTVEGRMSNDECLKKSN